MVRLEQLTPGAFVRGLVPGTTVKVVQVEAGLLIDTACAEPVMIEKHGRPVAVVLSVERYERLVSPEGRSEKAHPDRIEADRSQE